MSQYTDPKEFSARVIHNSKANLIAIKEYWAKQNETFRRDTSEMASRMQKIIMDLSSIEYSLDINSGIKDNGS